MTIEIADGTNCPKTHPIQAEGKDMKIKSSVSSIINGLFRSLFRNIVWGILMLAAIAIVLIFLCKNFSWFIYDYLAVFWFAVGTIFLGIQFLKKEQLAIKREVHIMKDGNGMFFRTDHWLLGENIPENKIPEKIKQAARGNNELLHKLGVEFKRVKDAEINNILGRWGTMFMLEGCFFSFMAIINPK